MAVLGAVGGRWSTKLPATMTLTISKDYADRLDKALQDWRAGPTRERIRAIVLDLLRIQRESPVRGRKLAADADVVLVSSELVRSLLPDSKTRAKFWKWIVAKNLVRKDGSWVSTSLGKSINRDARCNGWHITEPDCALVCLETTRMEYDPALAIYGRYRDAILTAEGSIVDGECFTGKWAIADYENGRIDWAAIKEVAKIAKSIIHPRKETGKVSCRDFDTITMACKALRPKCFVNPSTGAGLVEVFDIPGAITVTARIAASYLCPDKYGHDGGLPFWADNMANGISKDPYKAIYDAVLALDPKTAVFGRDAKWCKSVRKTIKMDVQVVSNCDSAYLAKCEDAYAARLQGGRPAINLRRQWLVWQGMRRSNEYLWRAVLRCKRNGAKDAFYRLHTLGEKMVMSALLDWGKHQGVNFHRVHDAIWCSDERVTGLSERDLLKVIGRYLGIAMRRGGYGFFEKYVSAEEVAWVREAFTLTEEEERRMGWHLMAPWWQPSDTINKVDKKRKAS